MEVKKIGYRLIYNKENGNILNGTFGEMEGTIPDWFRPKEIGCLDLPYGYNDNNFRDALEYHIDVSKVEKAELKDIIVITKYKEHIETEEEKLRKENKKLEKQLLDTQEKVVNDKYNNLINK